jgi:hypothetical protein
MEDSNFNAAELVKSGRTGDAAAMIKRLLRRSIQNGTAKLSNRSLQIESQMDAVRARTQMEAEVVVVPPKYAAKSGIYKERWMRPSDRLQRIIEREIGLKIECSSCRSEMAVLNRMSAADVLLKLEDLADSLAAVVGGDTERHRIKSWICEAVQ